MELLWSRHREALVTLDIPVDPPHKQIRTKMTHSSCTFEQKLHFKEGDIRTRQQLLL